MRLLVAALVLSLVAAGEGHGEDWPQWRGPSGPGISSPAVSGDRVFVTSQAAFLAVVLLASLLPQEGPRIDGQPKRVCLDASRAIFQVENRGAEPIVATLSLERWSDEGDTPGWEVVQADVTQRDARPKQARDVKLDARQRRTVAWELTKRVGPPALATGRHRLVVTWSYESGEPSGTVTHEFVLADCGL